MENDLLLDDEDVESDEEVLAAAFLSDPSIVIPEEKPEPVVKLDASDIGKTIADALSGATSAQTASFRALAQEFISAQPKATAAPISKADIAARNQQIANALIDTTGDVDVLALLQSFVKPMLDEGIASTLRTVRPEADNLAASQGERLINDFRRDSGSDVHEKLRSKYLAEIDKLVPESKYAAIASATPAQRKAFFEEIEDRAYAKAHRTFIKDTPPRGQAGSSVGGVSKGNAAQQALSALSKEDQRDAMRFAKAFAKGKGFAEGTSEYIKVYNAKLQDYAEG
jgi:hypothetical protein